MRRRALALVAAAGLALAVAPPAGQGGPADPAPAGGLTALPEGQGQGPNLVDNASFETVRDRTLAGWGLRLDGELWAVVREGRDGRAALRLDARRRPEMVPSTEQTLALEPGLYTVEGWVKTRDVGAADPRSGVRVCLDARPAANWWQCSDVARGTTDWTPLRVGGIPVRERGRYKVWLGTYGTPDGTAWFDTVSLAVARKPPLDVFLLYPNFRGMLFDDRPQTVRVSVGTTTRGGRVRLALLDEASGQARAGREYDAAPALTAELEAGALPAGRYLLRVELLDASGTVVGRHPDYRIVKTPARARERLATWYDERNVVHFGGKPAFVLGIYTTSGYSTSRGTYASGDDGWGNDRIAQAPINLLINYHLGRAPIPALGVYLDDLHARGIRYLQTVNFYHRQDGQYREIDYPAARQGEDELNRWVARTLGAHPGLGGFYVMDEQSAEMVPTVFRQYRALAAAAPGSITYGVLGDGKESQAPLWRDALDVMGLDPVPDRRPRRAERPGHGRRVDAHGAGGGEAQPPGLDGAAVLPDQCGRWLAHRIGPAHDELDGHRRRCPGVALLVVRREGAGLGQGPPRAGAQVGRARAGDARDQGAGAGAAGSGHRRRQPRVERWGRAHPRQDGPRRGPLPVRLQHPQHADAGNVDAGRAGRRDLRPRHRPARPPARGPGFHRRPRALRGAAAAHPVSPTGAGRSASAGRSA